MQKTAQTKLHTKNINLHRATPTSGAIGERHSRLVDRLASEVQARRSEVVAVEGAESGERLSEKEKELLKRICEYDRQEGTLKREMVRMSDMAKAYKNSKIEMEIKNQSLLQECTRNRREADELRLKLELLTQLNAMLVRIAENSLQVLPHYTDNCDELLASLEKVREAGEGSGGCAVSELRRKLEAFRAEMDNIQACNRKLMAGLAEAQQETKSISQRISLLSELQLDDLLTLTHDLHPAPTPANHPHGPLSESASSAEDIPGSNLGLYSHLCEQTVIPQQTSRMTRILQAICLLFEQHIHLLQTQKMEYQFTKNKKLITAQKYECEICESYEKIVSQIFSIVREAFKEIKFQFLREIKQVDDIEEIPFLI